MTSVTNALHALTCASPASVLHPRPARRADQRRYRVKLARLARRLRAVLDILVLMATAVRNSEHLAEDCLDPECPRFPCQMFHRGEEQGYRRGYGDGYRDGYSAGYAAGYIAGFTAGAASAAGKG